MVFTLHFSFTFPFTFLFLSLSLSLSLRVCCRVATELSLRDVQFATTFASPNWTDLWDTQRSLSKVTQTSKMENNVPSETFVVYFFSQKRKQWCGLFASTQRGPQTQWTSPSERRISHLETTPRHLRRHKAYKFPLSKEWRSTQQIR